MLPLERIIGMGITGSGKSYQWLKMAEVLLPTGAKFRCLDTDNDIPYMLHTQFPHLLPENGGNVYVLPAVDWPEYKAGVFWLQRKPLTDQIRAMVDPVIVKDWGIPIKLDDWIIVDKANAAWDTVQRYFTESVFGEDIGDYFLEMRRLVEQRGGKGKDGKIATSIAREAFDGWKDWGVINKLYFDWVHPIVYRVNCHVYVTTDVEKMDRGEKDTELLTLFGDFGLRPSGQKKLGGQMHTIFLYMPGKDHWEISTAKDRAGRLYFDKTRLISLFHQYLVAKAGWPIPQGGK